MVWRHGISVVFYSWEDALQEREAKDLNDGREACDRMRTKSTCLWTYQLLTSLKVELEYTSFIMLRLLDLL